MEAYHSAIALRGGAGSPSQRDRSLFTLLSSYGLDVRLAKSR